MKNERNSLVKHIGVEFEIPLVNKKYLAANHKDVENIYLDLITHGWSKILDKYNGVLVGVQHNGNYGVETINTDLGVCSLEIALPPVESLNTAIEYWKSFRSELLLPTIRKQNLYLLGFGTQPKSIDLKNRITQKGHYSIFPRLVSKDVLDWYYKIFPGLCSAQFNFEIPNHKVLQAINTLLNLSPVFWAAGSNDFLAQEKILPYRSQRYQTYKLMAKGRLNDRFGLPNKNFNSLCEYIQRAWEKPICEIVRNGVVLYPKNPDLSASQFISLCQSEFVSLDGRSSYEEVRLDDLRLAIYFSWLECRAKIFFKDCGLESLISAVGADNDTDLLDLINYTVLEVRPLTMQNNQEEIGWMTFIYLLLQNLDDISRYSSKWKYEESKKAAEEAQINGLRTKIGGVSLGKIGGDLLKLVNFNEHDNYQPFLKKLFWRFENETAPFDDAARELSRGGIEAFLDQLVLK